MSAVPEETGTTRAAQYAFAAHIRDPEHAPAPADVEPRRMAVYTELFYNNIESLLAANFPVIRRLHDDDAWHERVRDFYREHRSRTPLFTEIAREFIRHLERRAESGAGDPPFLLELAHYEWSELALSLDEPKSMRSIAMPMAMYWKACRCCRRWRACSPIAIRCSTSARTSSRQTRRRNRF